jgi:urease accessory protein
MLMPTIPAMSTTITTTMTTSTELYRLLAWFSPSYPIGAFSYSHGVEYAVETGRVTDVATLTQWIAQILRHGAGWVDAVLLKEAHAAADDMARLDELADLAAAWRGTAEMALESTQQGGSYLSVTRAAWGQGNEKVTQTLDAFAALREDKPVPLCIAVGVAAGAHKLSVETVLAAYLHAFAVNLVSAAVRLIPLGQTDGQRTLAALMPVVESIVPCALACSVEDCGTASPMVDLTSMMHETQYTRLFRS